MWITPSQLGVNWSIAYQLNRIRVQSFKIYDINLQINSINYFEEIT